MLSQDGGLLYVSQPALGQVSIIRASTGRIYCIAHLPGQPSLLTVDPDMNILYAAGSGSSQVTALDPTNCKILNAFGVNVGGIPRFIITGLYPSSVLNIQTPVSNPELSQQITISRIVWVIVFTASLITIIFVALILVWRIRRWSRTE